MRSRELELIILMGPFQLQMFYDSVIPVALSPAAYSWNTSSCMW